MAYSLINFNDDMDLTEPWCVMSDDRPAPVATSTPGQDNKSTNVDQVFEAIGRLSSGIEEQRDEFRREMCALTRRIESIEMAKQKGETSDTLRSSNPRQDHHGEASDLLNIPVSTKENSSSSHARAKPLVRPTTYNGSTSWEDYQAQFELVAEINGWDQTTKATYLAVSLSGPAQAVLGDLDRSQRTNFKELVSALNNRFGNRSRTEMFRVTLRNRKRQKNETLPELAQAVRRLSH